MTGRVEGFHQFWRTSPTTPTMVSHGSVESCGPSLMRCPGAPPFGQKRLAMPRLITATRAESLPSRSENTRPTIEEIFKVSKKSGLAICKSAEGKSVDLG